FIFFQFIWKDIYMLFMYKQLWSMVHSTIISHRAKYLYACIFGFGTLGALMGSFISGFFTSKIGIINLFFCTPSFYFVLYFSYYKAYKRSSINTESFSKDLTKDPRAKEGFALIRRSPLLLFILLLIICMQIS